MKSKNALSLSLTAIAVAAVALAAGCSVPGNVDGVFHGDGFSLRSNSPLTKATDSGRDRIVVLSESDSETLRTVNFELPNAPTLPLNKPIAMGATDSSSPSVVVDVGDLVIETRDDGVQILSAENDVQASSTKGTITLTEMSDAEVSGTFHADLDDGGYVEGDFTAFPST